MTLNIFYLHSILFLNQFQVHSIVPFLKYACINVLKLVFLHAYVMLSLLNSLLSDKRGLVTIG